MTKVIILFFSSILLSLNMYAGIDTLWHKADLLSTKDFDKAVQLCNEGITKATTQKEKGIFYRIKGKAFYFKGNFNEAAKLYMQSISLLNEEGSKKELGLTYLEQAKLYRKTSMLDAAAKTYSKALAIFISINDTANIATTHNESGVVDEYKGNFDEAIIKYSKALHISQQLNDTTGIAYALSFISGAAFQKKNYTQAFDNAEKALKLFKAKKDSFAIAITSSDIGSIYLESGNNINEAINYISQSKTIAQKMLYKDLLSKNYLILSNIYKKNRQDDSALYYLEKHVSLKDSLFNDNTQKTIAELNTKYDVLEKDKNIIIQQNKINKRNNLLIAALTIIILLIVLAYLFYNRYKSKQKAKLQQAIIKQQDEAAKAVVSAEENERTRMSQTLHDGLGQLLSAAKMNLQAVQENLQLNPQMTTAYNNALMLVDDSIKEMRSVSHQMVTNNVVKTGLANALKELIEKIDTNRLRVNLNVNGLLQNIDTDIQIVVYRIIQESINNVIKHAQADTLNIDLDIATANLTGRITDNGVGFDTSKPGKRTGIGLDNIATRIKFLKGKVDINSSPGKGTELSFQIPVAN